MFPVHMIERQRQSYIFSQSENTKYLPKPIFKIVIAVVSLDIEATSAITNHNLYINKLICGAAAALSKK